MAAPASAAATSPIQRSPPWNTVIQPTMAPRVMMPSMPRLRTPARSQIRAPRVPKISGVAILSTAAQSDAVVRMSRASVIGGSGRW